MIGRGSAEGEYEREGYSAGDRVLIIGMVLGVLRYVKRLMTYVGEIF